jgi:diguanylate cyclase (GGDEF)-like protein
MDEPSPATLLKQARLGAGSVAVMVLVLALAAVLKLVEPEAALESCVALGALVGIFYALFRSGFSRRFADPTLAMHQLVALMLLLAWVTYRAQDTPAVISVLYLVAMFYGVLRLDRTRLAIVAIVALVAHGTAVFLLIDRGHKVDHPAAWTQFGALALAFAWFTYAGGTVQRLRTRLAEAHGKLLDLGRTAGEQASRDALTGAYHRHYMLDALERETSRADRFDKPLCVARVDLDRFSSLNDTFGREAGDKVLQRFAESAFGAVRDVDIFGRWGGKSFFVVMPDTSLEGALVAAGRLRSGLERAVFPELNGLRRVTCTIGLSPHNRNDPARNVLARAEAGLNYAKAAGGDRVVAVGIDGKPLDARRAVA